jgi:branched-chain amino acid transport system substrate-binding protein
MPRNRRHVAIWGLGFAKGNPCWFLVAFLGLSLFSGCQRKSTDVISIGHVASFRGPEKISGEHAKQGIELALQGDTGKIDDRHIQVIHVDSGGDVKAAEAASVRLAVVNRVIAFLAGTDNVQSSAMEAIARNNEIPLVTSASQPGQVPSDFVFRTGLSPEAQAKKLAEFAGRQQAPPIKKVVVLVDGTDKGLTSFLADQFAKEFFNKKDRSLTGQWTYRKYRKGQAGSEGEWELKNSDELKEINDQIRKSKPDAILLAGVASDLAHLRKAGLDESLPVFFAGDEGSEHILQMAGGHQPVYLVTAFALTGEALQKDFVTQYEKQFHGPPDVHAALAYDNTRILIDALKRASSPKAVKIKEALEELRNFQTLTGKASFSKESHWLDREALLVKVQDGVSTLVTNSD